jgi:hypothetical protein
MTACPGQDIGYFLERKSASFIRDAIEADRRDRRNPRLI